MGINVNDSTSADQVELLSLPERGIDSAFENEKVSVSSNVNDSRSAGKVELREAGDVGNKRTLAIVAWAASHYLWILLALLLFHTFLHIIVLRYSGAYASDGSRYIVATLILSAEVVKLAISSIVFFCAHGCGKAAFLNAISKEMKNGKELRKIALVAVLYIIENFLLYCALDLLDSGTFQVTYQAKILTTAFFYVVLFGQKLKIFEWGALLMLTGGTMVLLQDHSAYSPNEEYSFPSGRILGLACALIACFTSGFYVVFYERILKEDGVSLWIKNFQLALISIVVASLFCLLEYKSIRKDGFFHGYDISTVILAIFQSTGCLLTSLVMKFAGNILKEFAISMSIVCTFVFWFLLEGFSLNLTTAMRAVGGVLVLAATALYAYAMSQIVIVTA